MKISVDAGKCTACGRCVEVCRINFSKGEGGKAKAADPPGPCMLCGHCVAVCPAGAIAHDGLAGLAFSPLGARPGFPELMALLRARRSRREFTDEALTEGELASLLAAAAQAPNGLNRKNVRYAVVTDRKVLAELSRRVAEQTGRLASWLEIPAARALFKLFWGRQFSEFKPLLPLLKPMAEASLQGDDLILYKAPCAILVHTERHDFCGPEDAVYCGANILLAAEALGLGACVIGFLTEPVNGDPDLRRLAGVPAGHKVHTSIVVGRPRFPYARGIEKIPPPKSVE